MQEHLLKIVEHSLGSTPEDMLSTSLDACIEMAHASGGSILAEEGPTLKFLFSDKEELIGLPVPFSSLAGETTVKSLVIYTYAPTDKRHYESVDEKTKSQTKYLLSIPIPSVHSSSSDTKRKNSGALQLLFEENIFPNLDVENGPQEFHVDAFKDNDLYKEKLKDIFMILPIIAFGMEIVNLRQTSYQAIHELKNKMISGLSWINYLKEDIKALAPEALEDESVKEDFELAESSIREGSELAKTYLQFTKIFSPKFEDANINDVLKETAASVKALAKELGGKDFTVKQNLDAEISDRQIDSSQLKMAFFNLCKNGVEALVQFETPTPSITISSTTEGAQIKITIEDNGPGMPPEIAENLFIPFKTKKEGGTGLGLTITKKIIDIHGGSVTCSTGDSGTTFEIII
jgi:signal transduction histidine kinase